MLKKPSVVDLKVETFLGDRIFSFVPTKYTYSKKEVCCEDVCPYGNICEQIRDPRNPKDQDSSFADLCDSKSVVNLIPAPGSIEKALYIEFRFKNKKKYEKQETKNSK